MKNSFTYKNILLTAFLLMLVQFSMAQVGGNNSPLIFSTHTYRIVMGLETNIPSWRIYSGHLTTVEIESGSYETDRLVRNTDYTVNEDEIEGGIALFEVFFNNPTQMPVGDYTIAYNEINGDNCFKTVIYHIQLHTQFDVDVALDDALDAADCSDYSDSPQLPDFEDFQTRIPYRVTLVYPDAGTTYGGDEWSFRFTATASGQDGGDDATVALVEVDFSDDATIDQTLTPTGTPSSYSEVVTVDNSSTKIHDVIVWVTYNDVLGVSQDIEFELTEIDGSYIENDVDNLNRVTHEIFEMPDVGDIIVLN
ncbi:MAG: hypothetical protein PF486_11245 [Prolixibacteraceae bacterium]|jgi:hypothetical protein|nr:hypothetical protein [Prolixibacteraceae bacterium]